VVSWVRRSDADADGDGDKGVDTSIYVAMCREGRLCEERLQSQSPLEKSDITEESRAIVGVLRAVEEALRHCVRTHAKGVLSAVEHPDQNTYGSGTGRTSKPRQP
jgi:hypothetical protein